MDGAVEKKENKQYLKNLRPQALIKLSYNLSIFCIRSKSLMHLELLNAVRLDTEYFTGLTSH